MSLTVPDDLRAITLWQPLAQLVAVGAKQVETRGRRCNHRGPVAIHAASRLYTAADKHADRGFWFAAHDVLDFERNNGIYLLPYGAIVAVANLVDCVCVYPFGRCPEKPGLYVEDTRTTEGDRLWLCRLRADGGIDNLRTIEDQRPYGDLTPGRYALLLEDVIRLPEPVPAKGNQAVPWRVPAEVAAKVREQVEGLDP